MYYITELTNPSKFRYNLIGESYESINRKR